ncbi:hypothetical protein GYMLUDRAFT_167209, partial [Collybiopsis luxurians FD-317 M1]
KGIKARLYQADRMSPRQIMVHYRANSRLSMQREVLAASTLRFQRTQPYVHDIIVTVFHQSKLYKFHTFFRRHVHLPRNRCVVGVNDSLIGGDLLIVACGKEFDVRNMKGSMEMQAADFAVRRYVCAVSELDLTFIAIIVMP